MWDFTWRVSDCEKLVGVGHRRRKKKEGDDDEELKIFVPSGSVREKNPTTELSSKKVDNKKEIPSLGTTKEPVRYPSFPRV